jgi:hypothetical protein
VLEKLQSTHHVVHMVLACSPLGMLVTSAQLAPVRVSARRAWDIRVDVLRRSQDWNATIPTEPRREVIEVLRLDGGFVFSRNDLRGEMGSVLRFELPENEAMTILESSMPPCSLDADVIQHNSNEVRDVDGKRYVEVETRRDATTYLFILSESLTTCLPTCCFTFVPVPRLSTGVVRSTAPFSTATAVIGLPPAMFPGAVTPGTVTPGIVIPGTVTSPSHTLISASSLATGALYGAPSKGSGIISPPIENGAGVAMHMSWLFSTSSIFASSGVTFWIAKCC